MRKLILAILLLGGLLAAVWFTSWRSPPYHPALAAPAPAGLMLSDAQYEQLRPVHADPYVVRAGGERGRVVLFGSEHSRDPAHPQLAQIDAAWSELRPTVALVEGRLGFLLPWWHDPVRELGEGGHVAALAKRDGTALYTWELPREQEVQQMLAEFPRERVALYYVLRPYCSTLRHGRPEEPDAALDHHRRARTAWPGLEGTLPDVAAVDAIWRRDFAGVPDWRVLSDEHGWPGYLAGLASRSNRLRDERLAQLLLGLAARGERVFAVAGSSHAVRLEPVLRTLGQ